jgi:YVTN family beta-propeller protein
MYAESIHRIKAVFILVAMLFMLSLLLPFSDRGWLFMNLTGKPQKLIGGALLALGLAATAQGQTAGVAYISNQNGGITVLDLATLELTGSFDVGAKGPRGIGVTADGKYLVTANKDDANVSIIDLSTRQVVKRVKIGKNPEFVRVLGGKAFVTYEPSSKGGPPPKPGVPVVEDDDDDDKVPARIAIVDISKGKLLKEITSGPETEGIEFTPDGKRMIVTNEADNTITVHDIASGKLLKTIPTSQYGDRPRGIKASPDGKRYVATLEFGNKLLVLDEQLDPIKAVETGKTPYGVAFDRSGQRIFVAASRANTLQVFDAASLEKIKDIPSGERCWHFTFTPDGKQILLACGRSDEVIVFDADKLEVTKRIANKGLPWGIVTYPKAFGSLDQP